MDARDLLRGLARRVSFVRADPKQDAYAKVRSRPRREELPDYTSKFLKAISYPIPDSGQVIFLNIPLFGNPGDAKTTTALTTIFHLLDFYGWDKVSVYVSDHLPSLADALRDRASPVQILVVDDALKHYNSRSGGNDELLEAIGLFTTLRHEFEAAQHTLNGVVLVFFTSQMYKGLDKVFREGFPIFKSALVSDKDEILSATKMGAKAWDYLNQVLREVKVLHRFNRKADGIVVLPGYPAGRLHLDLLPNAKLNRILQRLGTPECLEALESEHQAVKYKAIERAWTIPRRILTREEQLARLNALMDDLALQFASEREEDATTAEGRAALREWLDRRAYALDLPSELRLASEDYLRIRGAGNLKTLCDKVATQRKKLGQQLLKDEGLPAGDGPDGAWSVNQLLDFVAGRMLEEGLDPDHKFDQGRLVSRLYTLHSSIRSDAVRYKTAILSRMRDLVYRVHGARPKKPVAEAVVDMARHLVEGDHFQVDAAAMLNDFIEAAKTSGQPKLWRKLMVYRACHYKQSHGGRVLGDPTTMAESPEGQAWQLEALGEVEPLSRPQLQKDKSGGSSYLHNEIGKLFEAWIEDHLKRGFVVPGVFEKPIANVLRGGGNEHQPDIVVTYQDGSRDYVSLKCYHTSDPISITLNESSDEIHPERQALLQDEARGVKGSRLVLVCRNLYYPNFQGIRIWTSSRDIPHTIGFNKAEIGATAWTKLPQNPADPKVIPTSGLGSSAGQEPEAAGTAA